MRLFEAILDANQRALSGDTRAGLHPSEFGNSLPVVALTCIDPRLNRLIPEVLGISEEDFIWLRNSGNILFDSSSGMIRSLAMACAIKGGKEIAVIGHTDCRVQRVSVNQLIDSFRALGIQRSHLPENLVEFFGLFASERQNVINGVSHIRQSRLISPKVPVHGLMVDIQSGKLEWVVNGYESLGVTVSASPILEKIEQAAEMVGSFNRGELKLPEVKIGDFTFDPQSWLSALHVIGTEGKSEAEAGSALPESHPTGPSKPPKPPQTIPVPPPIRLIKALGKLKK